MADSTSFLGLVLPGKGEYRDLWWEPLNDNFSDLDTWANGINNEIVEARQSTGSLKAFLEVGHDVNGNLKPTQEVAAAQSSSVYGFTAESDLGSRLKESDLEIWRAREGYPALRDSLAMRMSPATMIISGTKSTPGYPTWMGHTGAKAEADGSVTPLMLSIDGKICRIRTQKELTLSGGSGVKYVYAAFQAAGVLTVDGDSGDGTTMMDGDLNATLFSDTTRDFSSLDVKAGDILTILGLTKNAGQYIIQEIAPGGVTSRLKIIGKFSLVNANLSYTIHDPLAVTLGFDTTEVPATGKIYIGEADYDGVNTVTAVRPRHFKDTFVGEWRAVDATAGGGVIEQIYNHALGSDILDISVQASQANDGTGTVVELMAGSLTSTLGFTPGNGTLAVNITDGVTWNAGTSDATHTGTVTGSLTGTVGGALSGSVNLDNAVLLQWNKNQVWVKNAVVNKFYRDYSGAVKTGGFLRVIVRKRG